MAELIESILRERGGNYGDFFDNARIAQKLKSILREERYYAILPTLHKEAIDVMLSKVSRIMSGTWRYKDNWDDIAGYAMLIVKRIDNFTPATIPSTEAGCLITMQRIGRYMMGEPCWRIQPFEVKLALEAILAKVVSAIYSAVNNAKVWQEVADVALDRYEWLLKELDGPSKAA